jgi:hypothetical protein
MQFVHYDLGDRNKGDVVRVTLDKRACVRLLDESNFRSYRGGNRYQFFGGEAVRSPVPSRCHMPDTGMWLSTSMAARDKSARLLTYSPRPLSF